MDHRRRKFWCPLARLGTLFGAIVVSEYMLMQGALLIQDVSIPADDDPDADHGTDVLGRAKHRLQKRLKSMERLFLGTRAGSDGSSGGIFLADPVLEPAQETGPLLDAKIAVETLPATIACPGVPLLFAAWQILPDIPRPHLPIERVSIEFSLTPELIERYFRFGAADPVADVGDALLFGPGALLDGALHFVSDLLPRTDTYGVQGQLSASITERILEIQVGVREGRIATAFASNWLQREGRYLSRFSGSELSTLGVEDGTEAVDSRALLREQEKVLWDAARKTYLSKYKFPGEDRIREDAFFITQWRGVDYAVLPPLIGGYLWWRGMEKRFSLGETWLRVSVEPLSKWMTGSKDMIAGVSVEWGIRGLPVALIVSAGKYDGKAGLDFIGIGTSIGMVRKAIGIRILDGSGLSSGSVR